MTCPPLIPFLNHPCTLPASLAAHLCRLRCACANDSEMGSDDGPLAQRLQLALIQTELCGEHLGAVLSEHR